MVPGESGMAALFSQEARNTMAAQAPQSGAAQGALTADGFEVQLDETGSVSGNAAAAQGATEQRASRFQSSTELLAAMNEQIRLEHEEKERIQRDLVESENQILLREAQATIEKLRAENSELRALRETSRQALTAAPGSRT